jgi:hypothetical protein
MFPRVLLRSAPVLLFLSLPSSVAGITPTALRESAGNGQGGCALQPNLNGNCDVDLGGALKGLFK